MMSELTREQVEIVRGIILDVSRKLTEVINPVKLKPTQPWPPKGVAIEVDANGNRKFLPRTSGGDGFYYYPNGGLQSLKDTPWRYAPAPWDIAPYNSEATTARGNSEPIKARGWVVATNGECVWVWARDLAVGDYWPDGSTIAHIEYRDDV